MSKAKRHKSVKNDTRPEIVIDKNVETMVDSYPSTFTVKLLFNDAGECLYYKAVLVEECILLFCLSSKAKSKQLGKMSVVIDNNKYHLFEVLERKRLPLDQQAEILRFFNDPDTDIDAIFDYDGTGDNLYLSVLSKHGLVFLMFPAEDDQDSKVVWFTINGVKYFTSMLFAPATRPFEEDEKEWLFDFLSDKGLHPDNC